MKKQLLYAVALCSSVSLCAAPEDKMSPEMFTLENLAGMCEQTQAQALYYQIFYMIREAQEAACSIHSTFEKVTERLKEQFEPLNNIPNENTPEAFMMRQTLMIFKEALKVVAEVTRKNKLPAVDAEIFKKGVDAQATRLKVVEYIEALLK